MGRSSAAIESLETRQMLSITPGNIDSNLIIDARGGNSKGAFTSNSLNLLSLGLKTLATIGAGLGPSIVTDSSGDIFGTTPSTNSSAGSIFEIPAGTNTPKILASFGPNNSANILGINPSDILIDANGNLFGDCQSGGPDANTNPGVAIDPYGGTLWELPSGSSTIQLLSGLEYTRTQWLTLNAQGDLFGFGEFDYLGGADNTSTVFAWTPSGGLQSVEGGAQRPGSYDPAGLTTDGAGNLYILNTIFNGAVPATITRYPAGQFNVGAGTTYNVSGAAATYTFSSIASDTAGNLYLSSTDPSGLQEIPADGTTISTLANFTPLTQDAAGDWFGLNSTALEELPAGQTTTKTILNLTFNTQVSGLTADSHGNLFGIFGNSVFELPAVGSATLPAGNATIYGLTPAITQTTVPASAVAGVAFEGMVALQMTPLSGGVPAGLATTTLYAVSSSNTIKLAQLVQHYKTNSAARAGVLRLAANLPAGVYSLIAQTADAAGDTVNSAIGGTLTVEPPSIGVSATMTAITPRIRSGGPGIATLILTSTGNLPATGLLTVSITAGGYNLLTEVVPLKGLRTRRALRLRVKVPAGTPLGSYTAMMIATWNGVTQQAEGSPGFAVV